MTREQILQAAVLSLILGAERDLAHRNHEGHCPMAEDHDAVGIFGEYKFACDFSAYGLKVDRTLRLGGDEGIDFYTKLGTIDVKTARKAFNLLVEVPKMEQAADILVLCEFTGFTREPRLLGWEVRRAMAAAPVKEFGKVIDGRRVPSHYIPAESLRFMRELDELMEMAYHIPGDDLTYCKLHGNFVGDHCLLCQLGA